MAQNRPDIPLPMLREIRQRCGFGCVICGKPIYEYEHMRGWANVHEHVAKDITLLCPAHHTERTKGLLPIEAVHQANDQPHNLRTGVSPAYTLHFSGADAIIDVGTNIFAQLGMRDGHQLVAISIDGLPIVAFVVQDSRLLLNVLMFDEFNARTVWIVNNELQYLATNWDVEFVGRTLTVREAHRKLLLEIAFCPPSNVVVKRARIMKNGVELLVRESNILLVNTRGIFQGNHLFAPNGIVLGYHPVRTSGCVVVPNINRYKLDRRSALEFERRAMRPKAGPTQVARWTPTRRA